MATSIGSKEDIEALKDIGWYLWDDDDRVDEEDKKRVDDDRVDDDRVDDDRVEKDDEDVKPDKKRPRWKFLWRELRPQ